jgi:hypothetical protein
MKTKLWAIAAALVGLALLDAAFASLWYKYQALSADRAALRATVAALREGDGSCAVRADGVRVVCWMEEGGVKVLTLKPGDVIVSRECLTKRRRAECAR